MSNDPAKIDISGKIRSENNGANFRSVGYCQGLEHSEWYADQDLASKKSLYILSKEVYENESNSRNERDDHGLSISISFRYNTVDE